MSAHRRRPGAVPTGRRRRRRGRPWADFGFTPMSELAGCTFSSTHLRISESAPRSRLRSDSRWRAMLSTSVASSVRVASSRVTSSRKPLVRLGLQLRSRRLGGRDRGPSRLLGLGDDRGGFRLALPLRLVDELLRQEKGALQRLVGQGRGVGRRRGGSRLPPRSRPLPARRACPARVGRCARWPGGAARSAAGHDPAAPRPPGPPCPGTHRLRRRCSPSARGGTPRCEACRGSMREPENCPWEPSVTLPPGSFRWMAKSVQEHGNQHELRNQDDDRGRRSRARPWAG